MPLERVILHLDMDAFYAAVEVREQPRLAGRALIIGHRGRRGVVSTCSYEARRFGVRSAMPAVTAERLCPDALWLPGRMELYGAVSRAIRRIMDDFSPLIEPLSIDEAFIDLTGVAADLEQGRQLAQRLKARIRDEQRLGSSVGLSSNKFLAKIASDLEKPDGLVLLPEADVPQRLWPLPVERLWGVGPVMAERLRGVGLGSVGELHRAGEQNLARHVGPAAAAHLSALARGVDERPVVSERAAKSISEERTYGTDLCQADEIDRALLARAEGVARRLRRQKLVGSTLHLKVRSGDFTTWTRACKLAEPTDLAEPLLDAARLLFAERIRLGRRGVRLLGLGVSGLAPRGAGQAVLFEADRLTRARRLAGVADAVRERMGEGALTRARLLRSDRGGPDDEEASSLPSVD